MKDKIIVDTASVGTLSFGALYLNFVSTYGAALVTTLAVLTGVVTLGLRGNELYEKYKRNKEAKKNGSQ